MNKFGVFLTFIFLVLTVSGLFQVKYKVQYLSKDVEELQRQHEHEKASIHILKAEWAFLNQPSRLKELTKRYLNLQAIKTSQLKSLDEYGLNSNKRDVNKNFYKVKSFQKKKTRWNYKAKDLIITQAGSKKPFISISGD